MTTDTQIPTLLDNQVTTINFSDLPKVGSRTSTWHQLNSQVIESLLANQDGEGGNDFRI